MQTRFDDAILHPQVDGIVRYAELLGNFIDGELSPVVQAIVDTFSSPPFSKCQELLLRLRKHGSAAHAQCARRRDGRFI